MKSKLFIFVVIIIVIIGIYFAVKKPSVEAPTIQDQTQTQSSSPADSVNSGMEEMSGEQMMSHEQSSTGEKISKHIVNYTDSGFSPSSLEIKAGETVRFANNSSGGMWVASGPHPAHTAYPEFDPKRNIPSGETYEFTFSKIGEWKYHNHTKAGMFGTIIVK